MNTENNNFLELERVKYFLKDVLREKYNERLFHIFLEKYIIIPIEDQEKIYLQKQDCEVAKTLLLLNYDINKNEIQKYGYNGSFMVERIKLCEGTFLIYPQNEQNIAAPAFVRNIILNLSCGTEHNCELCQIDILGVTIITTNIMVRDYVQNALYRKFQIDRIKGSGFAQSSYYMGSKRKIVGFIVESMYPFLRNDGNFLDLMCGSGAVSNAMAQVGDVWASDAQDFCQLLAKIQGKGFHKQRAEKLLQSIYPYYLENLKKLQRMFVFELKEEDDIFHMDLNHAEMILERYGKFIDEFALYSSTYKTSERICYEINKRKENKKKTPYCLFTYYFSNVYFGVAQCLQLDSLRYAIDQIEKEDDRQWALGVLVVVTSIVATTYGGHFAQPKKLELKSLEYILRQRQRSAWLEFSKRMLCLAADSERYPFEVNLLSGPWDVALKKALLRKNSGWLVYLDAPYKREEYSRYYHVLETIVKYDYPSAERKGRIRSKEKGERFSTEFFSKTKSKIESAFVKIIVEILRSQCVCVWSYSNNGDASIINVIHQVMRLQECNVYIYGMPYVHQSQGRVSARKYARKKVIEYCIIFSKEEPQF